MWKVWQSIGFLGGSKQRANYSTFWTATEISNCFNGVPDETGVSLGPIWFKQTQHCLRGRAARGHWCCSSLENFYTAKTIEKQKTKGNTRTVQAVKWRGAPWRKPRVVSLIEKRMNGKGLKRVCTGSEHSSDQLLLWVWAHSCVWAWSVANVKSAAEGASPSLVQDSGDIKGTATALLRAPRYCWRKPQIRTWRKFIMNAQNSLRLKEFFFFFYTWINYSKVGKDVAEMKI